MATAVAVTTRAIARGLAAVTERVMPDTRRVRAIIRVSAIPPGVPVTWDVLWTRRAVAIPGAT